jgi:lysophospholipase L1-like esterase
MMEFQGRAKTADGKEGGSMTVIGRGVRPSIGWVVLSAVFLLTAGPAQSAKRAPASESLAGMLDQPCPPALEVPAGARELLIKLFVEPRTLGAADFERLANNAEFKEFSAANRLRSAEDWAGRCTFQSANASALADPAPPRVVFMGDSITQNWGLADPKFFDHGILDRGISGQTSEQMLVRFRSDVVALRPKIVLILAGTNDVAGNTGPTSPQFFENNIMSMAEIARANGIEVVLCSIPPTAAFNWRPKLDPRPRIKQLNAWLRSYADQHHLTFVDYYPLLAGPAGEFRADLSNDGVHPNRSGYRLMRALVEKEVLRPNR